MDRLIRYVCVDPRHARTEPVAIGDLSVHAGSWAFCPADERGAHEWHQVGAATVEELGRYGLRRPHAGPVTDAGARAV